MISIIKSINFICHYSTRYFNNKSLKKDVNPCRINACAVNKKT
ncbi:Uncharacterised protein [Escherichia coli]|nr:Uncharacterised protein [Escherichia coli]